MIIWQECPAVSVCAIDCGLSIKNMSYLRVMHGFYSDRMRQRNIHTHNVQPKEKESLYGTVPTLFVTSHISQTTR